jgi:diguanylate cyclase (GGDEF)-like protein
VPRLLHVVGDHLPKGRSLPAEVWRIRHRTLTLLLWAHVPAIFVFGVARGAGVLHSAAEAGVVGMMAGLARASGDHRQLSAGATAVGLVMSSAVLVHLSGGTIEMHFHFFVMVCLLTLYQDWMPYLLAVGFVVVHHAVVGMAAPHAVYNHPAAVARPLLWALIHGLFVLGASAASIFAWRLNEEQALTDHLTRLPNRRVFADRLRQALARAQRSNRSLAVLVLDLDGFKSVNDTFGHAVGDQLLGLVAERLRAVVRTADTAARLGGDEFAVLSEDIVGEAEAAYLAERLLDGLAAPFHVRGHEITVGGSVGIALNDPLSTADQLLVDADTAMYEAKRDPATRYCVHVAAAAPRPQAAPKHFVASRR